MRVTLDPLDRPRRYLWCLLLIDMNSKIPPQPSITGCDGAVDPVLGTVRWIVFG